MMKNTTELDRREFVRTAVRWSAAAALGTVAGLGLFRVRSAGAGCLLPCTGCPVAGRCARRPAVRTPHNSRKEGATDESSSTTAFSA